MNEFFDELAATWVSVARRKGAEIDAPAIDSEIAAELLELARVTAHTQERRFAPLSSYIAGVAVERLRNARPGTDDVEVAELIREVRQELEKKPPAPAT